MGRIVIGSIIAVFLFEWKRALTFTRMLWWVLLAAFPVFIIGLIRFIASFDPRHAMESGEAISEEWRELCAWLIFALVPMLVSMLGTLLWTTPAISAELERRSWIYLAVRPHGGTAVLIGKYLAAVTWVIPPALLGLSIAVPLAQTGDSMRIWWSMTRLVCLSAPSFAAIYLLLGVILPKRAMVLAVAYTLLFELVISFVPAVINKLTVQYRLRSLVVEWCELSFRRPTQTRIMSLIGNESIQTHINALFIMIAAMLLVSIFILRTREFSTSAESDI